MRVYLAAFTLCLSAVFAAPTLDKQLDDHWEQWKNWHSKKYHFVSVKIYINKLKKEQEVELSVISFNTEGGGVEENGMGEKLE